MYVSIKPGICTRIRFSRYIKPCVRVVPLHSSQSPCNSSTAINGGRRIANFHIKSRQPRVHSSAVAKRTARRFQTLGEEAGRRRKCWDEFWKKRRDLILIRFAPLLFCLCPFYFTDQALHTASSVEAGSGVAEKCGARSERLSQFGLVSCIVQLRGIRLRWISVGPTRLHRC